MYVYKKKEVTNENKNCGTFCILYEYIIIIEYLPTLNI